MVRSIVARLPDLIVKANMSGLQIVAVALIAAKDAARHVIERGGTEDGVE